MQVHYISNFLNEYDMDRLDYYNNSTTKDLNCYIQNNVDTSYWQVADIIRVKLELYGEKEWYDNKGLYFWNGSKLITPFYNGVINYYGSTEYEVDQQINRFGMIPNNIQFIHDYEPNEPFCNDGLIKSKVLFSDLSAFYNDICSSQTRHNVGDSILSIADFYTNSRRYILIFFGEMTNEIHEYICQNRPYDFDVEGVLEDLNCGIDIYNIYDTKDSSSDDFHFIIPNEFLNINFNDKIHNVFNDYCSKSKNSGRKSKGVKYHNQIIEKKSNEAIRHKCISVTNKGVACSRMAQVGSTCCGIHSTSTLLNQCASVTAKGIQCGRDVKNGYNHCSIHIKKNKY
jgi:hypothetical protein